MLNFSLKCENFNIFLRIGDLNIFIGTKKFKIKFNEQKNVVSYKIITVPLQISKTVFIYKTKEMQILSLPFKSCIHKPHLFKSQLYLIIFNRVFYKFKIFVAIFVPLVLKNQLLYGRKLTIYKFETKDFRC